MAKLKLRGNHLIDIGFPQNKAISIAIDDMKKFYKRESRERVLVMLKEVLANPNNYMGDGIMGRTAEALLDAKKTESRQLNTQRAPYTIFGEDGIALSLIHI